MLSRASVILRCRGATMIGPDAFGSESGLGFGCFSVGAKLGGGGGLQKFKIDIKLCEMSIL